MHEFIEIPGGDFPFGSDDYYEEEKPRRRISVEPFRLSATAVTNAQFALFVEETGYQTVAEEKVDQKLYPKANPSPGSAVFRKSKKAVPLDNPGLWWRWIEGASWRHPEGPHSQAKPDHPVVQIAYRDALCYADWAGARLPSEQEWERAARGPMENCDYSGVSAKEINRWVGKFPYSWKHTPGRPRRPGTCSVRTFPSSPWGLYEMCGNVWEWTSSLCPKDSQSSCCDTSEASRFQKERILRGGSFLCADNYCRRYRVSARIPQSEDSPTNHIGFRIARDY